MARIPDLNPLSPTGTDPVSNGDNELRALKDALVGDGTASSGSFTPDFTGQYTGTADELNAVNTAGQAADGISYFDDVDTTGAADGDLLRFDGTEWLKSTPPPVAGYAKYDGSLTAVGSQIVFQNAANNVDSGLATIENPASGKGWQLTANQAVSVDLTLSYFQQWTVPSAELSFRWFLGCGLNVGSTAFNTNSGIAEITQVSIDGETSLFSRLNLTTTIVLADTDFINLTIDSPVIGGGTFITANGALYLTVRPV